MPTAVVHRHKPFAVQLQSTPSSLADWRARMTLSRAALRRTVTVSSEEEEFTIVLNKTSPSAPSFSFLVPIFGSILYWLLSWAHDVSCKMYSSQEMRLFR